jgi:hypothetical protein
MNSRSPVSSRGKPQRAFLLPGGESEVLSQEGIPKPSQIPLSLVGQGEIRQNVVFTPMYESARNSRLRPGFRAPRRFR